MRLKIASKSFSQHLVIKRNISVLFFGTDGFAKACLKSLHRDLQSDGQERIVTDLATVCLPEKQHKAPVKVYSEKKKIPCSTWPAFPDTKSGYDIGVVVSFGKLIPRSVIGSFKHGMINVHGSLLPRWRGASPLAHAIMAGDEKSGITIMDVKPGKFDHGGILERSDAILIKPNWTAEDLGIALEDIASECLLKCLKNIEYYKDNLKPQDENLVTYAPKITPEHTTVSWGGDTAETLYRKYLAYGYRKDLVLRTTFDGNLIKLQKLILPDEDQASRLKDLKAEPGEVVYDKNSKLVFVRCKSGFIGIPKLVLNKPLLAHDFYNGQMQTRMKAGEAIKFV